MQLFYQPEIPSGALFLDEEESRHAVRVLRLKEGDSLHITDGTGNFYVASITDANPKKCAFAINSKSSVATKDFRIHLAIAPTKNADRTEWFVEKATEIGVDEISFILCQNSERKVINLARIEKIVVSAMKQSQQAWLPKLNEMVPFKKIVDATADQKFIGYVDSTNPVHLKAIAKPGKKYLMLIGPEGDFSKEELALAIQSGFEKVSLGANRLRTETAALTACQLFHFIQR
ncbi:MAG: 16S rRNA (uracil(1498)-N(3))-methyltransferase [Bacteroidetes bacterium]|nr:16S rRNA (uracil(1498)-N(3))-methyltransferase [Bacteroidota bacterium]